MKTVLLHESVAQFLIGGVQFAFGDGIQEDERKNQYVTNNGSYGRKWDILSRYIAQGSAPYDILYYPVKRGLWTIMILYCEQTKQIITIMREDRLASITRSRGKGKKPHYIEALAYALNSNVSPLYKQVSIYDDETDQSCEMLSVEKEQIAQKLLSEIEMDHHEIGNHVLLLCSIMGYQVTNVNAVILDTDMRIAQQQNLSHLIQRNNSVIVAQTSSATASWDNPTHGLKLTDKALQRQNRLVQVKNDDTLTEGGKKT